MSQTTNPTVIRSLPVDLTDEELKHRAMRLAELNHQLDELDEKRRSTNQAIYREKKDLTAERKALTETVTSKREIREVKCEQRKDFKRSCIEIVRIDTGEVIDTQAMRQADLQMEMPGAPLEAPPKSTKDAAPKPRTPRKAPGKNGGKKPEAVH